MARQAINREKTERQMLHERVTTSGETVKRARDDLRQHVDKIRSNCPGAVQGVFERLRARFVEVGSRLQANLDPDAVLFDERFKKRAERAAQAGCRLEERKARIEAEPTIRAGKAAKTAHRATERQAQQTRKQERARRKEENAKIPRGAKMREVEDQIVKELLSDPETARLLPIWNRVRAKMYQKAKASGGLLSPIEAFAQYVEENFNEIEHLLDEIHAQDDKKLAKAQAADAKKRARESGDDTPSEAFRVPSNRGGAPSSGTRRKGAASEREAPRSHVTQVSAGPKTVASVRGT